MKLTGYEISRAWWDFAFANPERIKPVHSALLFFAIEHCNRLGWKEKFGLPSQMAMEAIGIGSYNTYIPAFNDLCEWGFFTLIQKSKNQYSSSVIALSIFDKATDKALDKALIKHDTKHCESTEQSTGSIDKQETKNKEQRTKRFVPPELSEVIEYVQQNNFLPDLAKQFYAYYTENDWVKTNKRPVKDWKLTMQTWMQRPDNQQYNIQNTIGGTRYVPFDPEKHF
jgi:hypothetical protein